MFLNKFSAKEIVMYMVLIYILKYVLYYIADYYDNYKYSDNEKVYRYTSEFTLMNKVLSFFNRLFGRKDEEGFQTYGQCRNLGYSKEFCVQTPVSVFGPAGCMCQDGRMGFTYPGLRGGCLCR